MFKKSVLNRQDKSDQTMVISPKTKIFYLGVRELIEYKSLIFLFFKRNFVTVYKQTILGPLWHLIKPFFTIIVYNFIFGRLAGLGTDTIPPYLFYLSGTILWTFFAQSLKNSSRTFLDNAYIFGKIYFPRLTVTLAQVLSQLVNLATQFSLFIVLYLFYVFRGMEVNLHWSLIFLPFLLLHLALFATGVGLLISSLTTKYRDLNFLVDFGMQLWMYATPVVYPLSEVLKRVDSPLLASFVLFNPVSFPIEVFRFMFFQTNEINWLYGSFSIGITLLISILGIGMFHRVERSFMDRI